MYPAIEIISPSNKQSGPDRRSYEKKQRGALESDANLVEIDLLRDGQRVLPTPQLEAVVERMGGDYLIVVTRGAPRHEATWEFVVYPVDLRHTLPCIPVPLIGDTPDVPLDLQVAVVRAYAGGPYRRLIDYAAPADPPLDDEDAAWAEALLQAAGLRAVASP